MQDDGMIVFHQLGQKVKIGKEYVLQQYVKVASSIPSFPTFPTGGYDAPSRSTASGTRTTTSTIAMHSCKHVTPTSPSSMRASK
jgi:hypothetical protein